MIDQLLKQQKNYFRTQETKSLSFRKHQLKKLYSIIKSNQGRIVAALDADLGKSEFESYVTEVGFVLDSLKFTIRKLARWTKNRRVIMPIHQPFSKGYVKAEPYGSILIIGPFNYPFQLLIEPLIGAMAAGNTVVLKPSEYATNTEKLITDLIGKNYDPNYINVVTGGVDVTTALIHADFDYIFFTGSVPVGKIIMKAASNRLIPITLELGGKSPAIVHKDANLKVAARRLVWGKFINNGQTCVAPDYVYVHQDIAGAFKEELIHVIQSFYGSHPKSHPDYGKIINKKHFERLVDLIDLDQVIWGGNHDEQTLHIDPTLMTLAGWDHPIMADEIFGPILPILTYTSLDEVIDIIIDKPKALAFYIFSESKFIQNKLITEIPFGGGCINDTITHLTSPHLPFGGVGTSGMGHYHGRYSFDTFSNLKSIQSKSTKVDLSLPYPPYKNKLGLVKKIMG